MIPSARDFLEREDAVAAGRHAGSSFSLGLLIIVALICLSSQFELSGWMIIWFGAFLIVGARVGFEYWMGTQWDHYERKRHRLMVDDGLTSGEAFDRVRT